jgi:hypothetical protein
VLYWELYDNEGTTEKPGGFWMINERNEKQPIWETHRRFYEWARKQALPDEAFRAEAIRWLKAAN